MWKRVASALFYAFSSFTITIVNKNILTNYNFPSGMCLGLGQILTTILLLYTAKMIKIIDFPDLNSETFFKLQPLPMINMGNLIFGLGGTKELSLPMYTALRRFLILITMWAEYYLLNVQPNLNITLSVYIMIIGALIAAYDDLGFSAVGYTYIFLNNIFSAANGVYIKLKLETKNEMGKCGLMFYNALFILIPTLIMAHLTGELLQGYEYPGWGNRWFLAQFGMSCLMGFILNYSVYLCTTYNSALGTSIIGCFKNACITYVGMVFGKDYIFSTVNCIGINISVAGSLIYLYCSQRTDVVKEKTSSSAIVKL